MSALSPANFDGVLIIGGGPNGLAAAIALLMAKVPVRIYEGQERLGGGLLCSRPTLPGFLHDHCAAVHTMGVLSPFLSRIDLESHGLSWCFPPFSAAHPFEDGRAAILQQDLQATAESLGVDARAYRSLLKPFLDCGPLLLDDLLAPLGWPRHPWTMLRFGQKGILPAKTLAQRHFRGDLARGLLAGCAAHSILPLQAPLSGALGLLFCLTGHWSAWPVVRGGSEELAKAMRSMILSLGGEVHTGEFVSKLSQLPKARAYLFDTSPKNMLDIAGERFSASYRASLEKYRYGPGVYKMDYALSEAIPWKNPQCGQASTVHVGGSLEDIAHSERSMWEGEPCSKPFVMVCQQSHFDGSRAPEGQHTGYAYLHVPFGYEAKADELIEAQIERFAPGFRECILAKHATSPADFERQNPAFFGGTVTGGVADWRQAFARPTLKLDPYRSSDPQIFIGSAASPPGGGIHGMSGYYAARSILRFLGQDSEAIRLENLAK